MLPRITVSLALLATSWVTLAAERPLTYDRIELAASATAEVHSDVVVAELYAQAEGLDLAAVGDKVDQAVSAGLKLAKDTAGITLRTLEYHTTPIYESGRHTGMWRVVQAIRLTSHDPGALRRVLGRMPDMLALRAMGYELSEAARSRALKHLTREAIEAFRARADDVTKAWGRSTYRLVSARVEDLTGAAPIPRLAAAAMATDRSAPVIEPGAQRITVTVHGTIELLQR